MLEEIFVSKGEGEPYIIVPDQFKLAIFEWLKDKIPCTFPRTNSLLLDGRPANAVLELVDASPKEAEKPLDEWFEMLSVTAEKQYSGHQDDPSCIGWRFDPNTYQQAQAGWLKNLRYEQSQKLESLHSI
jgi:hypothetical protein